MAVTALASVVTTLGAAVADDATFTVTIANAATLLTGSTGGRMIVNGDIAYDQGASGFTATYSGSTVTVTNTTGAALAAGSVIALSFGEKTLNGSYNVAFPATVEARIAALENA